MNEREQRRQRIRELLTRNQIRSQQELQDLLSTETIVTTQATLSRDLRDMGVTKGPAGYILPPAVAESPSATRDLERAMHGVVQGLHQAGNLVVVRTTPSAAQDLGKELDRARLRHVVGVIADEDTIFLATHSISQSGELLRLLRRLGGKN